MSERIKKILSELGSMGWRIDITFDYDGEVQEIEGTAGDDNCPHRKEYDQRDGHGSSYIGFDRTDDKYGKEFICFSLDELEPKLERFLEEANKLKEEALQEEVYK